jgi:hypothetical protein
MCTKKWLVRCVFGPGLAGALALGAQAQTPDPTPKQQGIHQDKKDIRQDKRDLTKDGADRNLDQRDINHDKADLSKDRADRNHDQKDINKDKRTYTRTGRICARTVRPRQSANRIRASRGTASTGRCRA